MKNIYLFICLFICSNLQAQDSTKIAIIGCHKQNNPAPALEYIANAMQPDYCVWVGDNVYADTRDDAQHIQNQLDKLAAKPGFQDLRDNSTFLVTWDDHDFGLNNEGKNYPLKEESKQIHRTFWQLENEIPADHDGVYYAKLAKQTNGKIIQFILFDGRYNRDDESKKADALGEKQWAWLEAELQKEADIRLIVSGYQVLLDCPTRWEAWDKLGKSRKRLFDLIKATKAMGVVFITGDQHYVEILKKNKALGYDAYEIMASGINQTERPSRDNNRIVGPDLTKHSAPQIIIYWEGTDEHTPHIHFTNIAVKTGQKTSDYRIFMSEIGL